MVDSTPTNPLGPEPIVPASPVQPGGRSDGAPREATDVTFQRMLERLQARAEELEVESKSVDDPTRLSGAVEAARASLEDAVSLGEELLEAFREASQQARTNDERQENDR